MPKISLVTSLYKAAPFVPELYERGKAALQRCADAYEFVFVDDGSPDDAKAAVLELIKRDANVRLVELSRNFGQHRALFTGLKYATGDLIFMIDADLEEDPELLGPFLERLNASGDECDVVYGVMTKRNGGISERLLGAVFYAAINRLSSVEIPRDILGARLMRREFVESLLLHEEAEPYLGGLMALTGYHQVAMPCEKRSRGDSSYTFRRKLRLASDALFGFSTAPLTAVTAAGLGIAVVTALIGALGMGVDFLTGEGFPEIGALLLWSIWFLGGLTLTGIGIVGMYTGRALAQARRRPVAIVKRVYGAPTD